MTAPASPLVFDTGPLRHFAVNGWLNVLRFVAGERQVVIPESVETELKQQARDLHAVQLVLDAPWIRVDRSSDLPFLASFAYYENRLAVGSKNRGECGVLALGKVRAAEVVLDDSEPRALAEADGIAVTATLPLLCTAIREGKLTVPMVEHIADDLIAGNYFLPIPAGGFRNWAVEQGLIDYTSSGKPDA